jgi:predicted pyridoxine 5'-phosphate oxidase superfamily flavin-nucleotide-binding protein
MVQEADMPILTDDMQKFVRQTKLGYVATVCPDHTPNLSPKGTLTVWDGDHLVFADLQSPGTVENLQSNPAIEVNVVDPVIRKGYRFKGKADLLTEGDLFRQIVRFYDEHGVIDAPSRIKTIVMIKVEVAKPVISPGYEYGITEEEVREKWETYYTGVHESYFRKS